MKDGLPIYADVILPLALPGAFTYTLPPHLAERVQTGMRVIVPLGRRKMYTGLVWKLHHNAPAADMHVKAIVDVVDHMPVLTPTQMTLWQWMAQYYLCHLGEVMKAALPSGMKMESETMVRQNPDFVGELDSRELQLFDLLQPDKAKSIDQLAQEMDGFQVLRLARRLTECGAAMIEEKMSRAYRPRTETRLRPGPALTDAESLTDCLRQLQRTPKQLDVFCLFLQEAGISEETPLALLSTALPVSKRQLAALPGFSEAALTALRRKGFLEAYAAEVGRIKSPKALPTALQHSLNGEQQRAMGEIEESWCTHTVCLLHGVTSSGKTEVYIELIRKELAAGRQVLYLVPEIALTTQLTSRLGRVFGEAMGVYHSKFPDAERVELWQRQLTDKAFPLILGVRSSIFLPFRNLGLIIVDEEHEPSYKQQDPAPRYNARDTAIMLARQTGARVLLGTATPAIESYHNARTAGKYGYVRMDKRFGDVKLPVIEVVDVKELHRKKLMKSPFSPRLTEEVRGALAAGGQAILFYNRRGFSPVLSCRTCGWTPHCSACDVALTYHQRMNKMVCHYCGATYDIPRQCPQCEDTELRDMGYGTEKIEAAVQSYFADAKTARMDLDTTRSRSAYEKIINDFQRGETNLLVGTQMVTKGLDFDKVKVVGILNADQSVNAPDFRAYERTFQMLSQVAGRAGRRGEQGRVILQTRQASLPLMDQVVRNDYEAMYLSQLAERKGFGYPPFSRLIQIFVKHREERVCVEAAYRLHGLLFPHFESALLGPDRPVVGRVGRLFIRKMLLKVSPKLSAMGVRRTLLAASESIVAQPVLKGVQVYFDADPL